MPLRSKSLGLSLLETTIAVNIIAVSLLVVLGLFHQGMKQRSETLQRKRAVLALASAHQELLAYSRQDLATKYGFDEILDWTSAQVRPVAADPEFQATLTCDSIVTLSPSSSFEQPFIDNPDSQEIALGPRVRVDLEVQGLGQTARSVFWLTDPPRELRVTAPLVITQTSGVNPLPAFTPGPNPIEAEFTAQLFDKHDKVIEGAVFRWSILPTIGNATILWEQDYRQRAGRVARLRNYTVTEIGAITTQPGELDIQCYTRYRGREVRAEHGPLVMAP